MKIFETHLKRQMQLNDPQLLEKVNAFSKKLFIKGMFVISAIESASLLLKEKKNYLDPITVWRGMYDNIEKAVRVFIEDRVQKDPEFATLCNKLITQKDLEGLPSTVISLLPSNILELKFKELEATLTVYDRLYSVHESLTPTEIIDRVLREFKSEIIKLSVSIKEKVYSLKN